MIDLFKFVLSQELLGAQEIQAPQGWDDMQHTLGRDAVYHGVTVSFTLDFNFVKDGREFLEAVYDKLGIEAEVLLIVYEYDVNQHEYIEAYSGRINLSKYELTPIDASSNAEESSFVRRILNLDDVEVDLTKLTSIDGLPIAAFDTDFQQLSLHSKATIKSYEGTSDVNQPEYDYRPATTEQETSGTIYIGWDNEVVNEFNAYAYPTTLNFSKDANPLIEFSETAQIKVEYKLDFHIQCYADKGDFKESETDFFIGINLPGPNVNDLKATPKKRIFSNNQDGLSGFFSIDVKAQGIENYDVNPGDALYFLGYAGVFDTDSPLIGSFQFEWKIELNGDNYIRVSGITKTAPSLANGMLIHEAYTRVIQSLTGRNNAFYSELLGRTDSSLIKYKSDGELSGLWLSNGSQIRGFPLAERPIYAKLKELFASTAALKPVGLGIEQVAAGGERVRLESLDFFYSDEVILEFGEVDDKMSIAQEYYYNLTEFGYKKWASNQQNSLDEVNTKQTRTTPITQLKSTYSRVSDYAGSAYLIEDVRRQQYSLGPDKESSDDKTNFWICVLRKPAGGFETERNQRLIVCNNVLDPDSIYNIAITPMRNFLRHDKVINASLKFQQNKNIAFNEGNANYLAETQFAGEAKSVIENMDIKGSEMRRAIWIPEYYEFDEALPTFERKKLEARPYGKISFYSRSKKQRIYGYIKEVKANVTQGNATFKLLRAAD